MSDTHKKKDANHNTKSRTKIYRSRSKRSRVREQLDTPEYAIKLQ